MKKDFPENFLWGVACSSHQVEGNNSNNDWWEWEQKGKTKEKSGWACDSWNRYIVDHKLAEDLGCNSFRLSLEWSRIEPEEGVFSEEALGHYKKVLIDLEKRGMKRAVTLFHWTLPIWFSQKYGWHHPQSPEIFSRYCQKVIDFLGDEMDILLTINEPRLILNKGYLAGVFPPGKHNPILFLEARKNLIEGHKRCFDLVKKRNPNLPVGITQFCNDFRWSSGNKFFKRIVERVEDFYNWKFFNKLEGKFDFVGINYYFGLSINLIPPFVKMIKPDGITTEMGWGIHPDGLQELIKNAWRKYKKPIYIFENGIADGEDLHRKKFIESHVKAIQNAISEGADVRGYFYWSLLDNFEWCEGFSKKFGLCEVDFESMERKPRKSYHAYRDIIRKKLIK